MPFKFERLEVWQLALEYIDLTYDLASRLPRSEEYNLKSQIVRAATSVALNIAEGSMSQTDPEQARFLSMAIRSLLETVACQQIIRRRGFASDVSLLDRAYASAQTLAAKLHSMRKAILADSRQLREEPALYETQDFEPDKGEL
jgi:four helix bundle protein